MNIKNIVKKILSNTTLCKLNIAYDIMKAGMTPAKICMPYECSKCPFRAKDTKDLGKLLFYSVNNERSTWLKVYYMANIIKEISRIDYLPEPIRKEANSLYVESVKNEENPKEVMEKDYRFLVKIGAI